MTFQFYIELEGTNPLVWRRIEVPANYTLYRIHLAFQRAFGWKNSHLFEFLERSPSGAKRYGVPIAEDPDDDLADAKRTKMSKLFTAPGQEGQYIYDFGDYWKHKVLFEKSEEKDIVVPFCMDGAGACPPEDVGGIHGYLDMIEAFQDSGSKEQEQFRKWLGLGKKETWDANLFSIEEANRRLAALR